MFNRDKLIRFDGENILSLLKKPLLKAFDTVTTFDMRVERQMELLDGGYYVQREKDGNFYTFAKWRIAIYDYDAQRNRPDSRRCAEFYLTLSPFNCSLSGVNEKNGSNSVYGGCNKELTREWRLALRRLYSNWKELFDAYCIDVRALQLAKAETAYEETKGNAESVYYEEINSLD